MHAYSMYIREREYVDYKKRLYVRKVVWSIIILLLRGVCSIWSKEHIIFVKKEHVVWSME